MTSSCRVGFTTLEEGDPYGNVEEKKRCSFNCISRAIRIALYIELILFFAFTGFLLVQAYIWERSHSPSQAFEMIEDDLNYTPFDEKIDHLKRHEQYRRNVEEGAIMRNSKITEQNGVVEMKRLKKLSKLEFNNISR